MKKRNIIAFAASMVIAASAFTGFTAFAAAPADAVGEGIVAKYDAASSTDTQKVIDLYYTDDEFADGISSYKFSVTFQPGLVTNVAYTGLLEGFMAPSVNNEQVANGIVNVTVMGGDLVTATDNKIGQLKVTVPAGTPTFDFKIVKLNVCATWDFIDFFPADITLSIPGAVPPTPVTPEPVVASKVDGEPIVEDGTVYTPFTALLDKAFNVIKLEINGEETNVTPDHMPTIDGASNIGIVVKSRENQTIGALKFYFE